MPTIVGRGDDIIEDHDLQEVALDKGIPDQVHPESITEYRHPLRIRILPLQPDEQEHTANQQTGGNRYNFIHLRSLLYTMFCGTRPSEPLHCAHLTFIYPFHPIPHCHLHITD